MSAELVNIGYIVAAALFIVGLRMLGSPATAVRGNTWSAWAMLIAIVVTLLDRQIITFEWIIGGAIVGAAIGWWAAKKVEMTSMPEMVALFRRRGWQIGQQPMGC